jgi:hypothetical protein
MVKKKKKKKGKREKGLEETKPYYNTVTTKPKVANHASVMRRKNVPRLNDKQFRDCYCDRCRCAGVWGCEL